MDNEEGIGRKLDRLIEVLSPPKEEKEEKPLFKKVSPWIPWKAKVGKRKAQKGFVTVMKINYNNTFDWERHEIKDGTIIVDGTPRLAYQDVIYRKGKPYLILHAGSTQPISTIESLGMYVEAFKTTGWRLLLNRIKTEGMVEKKAISMTVVWIVLALVAGGAYFAYKGGLFK